MDSLNIRLALITDLDIYFKWVNEIEVRKNSFDSNKIILKNHKNWFKNKLKSKHTHLLILEKESIPVGQIRFDIEDDKACIDFSIENKYRGQGLGSVLLKMGIQNMVNNPIIKNIKSFKAEVKTSNLSSIKVFENIGFEKKLSCYSNKVIFEKLIKN